MPVPELPADPHDRVTALLRARHVTCRGGLDDLADAVLTTTHLLPPPAPPVTAEELTWRRERAAVLLDRDVLVCALHDLLDALNRYHRDRTPTTAAALDVAVGDARDVRLAPGQLAA